MLEEPLFFCVLIPREAEDFPRCGKYPKHVPQTTCLDYMQLLINNSGLIFNYAKIMNVFTCGEEISKSIVVV